MDKLLETLADAEIKRQLALPPVDRNSLKEPPYWITDHWFKGTGNPSVIRYEYMDATLERLVETPEAIYTEKTEIEVQFDILGILQQQPDAIEVHVGDSRLQLRRRLK